MTAAKRRDPDAALSDMLTYALLAQGFVRGRSRSDFEGDDLLQMGLARAIELIEEARLGFPRTSATSTTPYRGRSLSARGIA